MKSNYTLSHKTHTKNPHPKMYQNVQKKSMMSKCERKLKNPGYEPKVYFGTLF